MKNLCLTTAMIVTLGGAAFAQTTTADPVAPADPTAPAVTAPATTTAPADAAATPMGAGGTAEIPSADAAATDPEDAMRTGLLRASALEGVDVYSVDTTGAAVWDDNMVYDRIDDNWDKIGEIEDLVIDNRGNVVGAIAEVGGFLGIGEKEVVLNPEEVTIIVTEDRVAVVSALSQEALENREEAAEDIYGND